MIRRHGFPCWAHPSYNPVPGTDYRIDGLNDYFKTAGNTECRSILEENELVLRIRGIIFDTVAGIGAEPPAPESLTVSGVANLIQESHKYG
jgi:hypothetical protein